MNKDVIKGLVIGVIIALLVAGGVMLNMKLNGLEAKINLVGQAHDNLVNMLTGQGKQQQQGQQRPAMQQAPAQSAMPAAVAQEAVKK